MLIFALVLVALIAWGLAYVFVIRPRLASIQLTKGIYAKLDAWEGSIWGKVRLRAHGLKTAMVGFVASMIPIAGPVIGELNGLNWSAVFPTERATIVAFVVAFLAAMGPLVMVVLHMIGVDDASKAAAASDSTTGAPPTSTLTDIGATVSGNAPVAGKLSSLSSTYGSVTASVSSVPPAAVAAAAPAAPSA